MPATFRYEDPFRPPYEVYSVLAWTAGALLLAVSAITSGLPAPPFLALVTLAVAMAVYRTLPAITLWRRQRRLAGHALEYTTLAELRKIMTTRPGCIWLGYGFNWGQEQVQRMHDLIRSNPEHIAPHEDENIGARWLHGLSEQDGHLWLPIDHTASHMLLVGTTRAGKTRTADLLITQSILRGEATIVIDPKGDPDLRSAMREACIAIGREKDLIYLHPAFPNSSHRIDPLMNFSRPSELATRIASLIASETGADPFVAFSQMALNNMVQGLLLVNEKPNLVLLRRYLEGGPGALVRRSCEAYFERKLDRWSEQLKPYLAALKKNLDDDYAMAYIQFYRESMQGNPKLASSELEGLFSSFEHDSTHMSKMITGLMPILNMLTSNDLGKLLSPDHTDMSDPRPITDFERIIHNKQICYIGLDSLSDGMVGSAIGSLMLSDLTAVAGARYNYSEDMHPVTIFADEANELVTNPFIALLNKSGGANFRVIVATQTFSDFAAKLGSVDKARMILGNLNNLLAMRIIDGGTQQYVSEVLPKTFVRHVEVKQDSKSGTDDPLHFSAGYAETLKETEVDTVPPHLFGQLPNLEFFARVSGGRILKGRVPILQKVLQVAPKRPRVSLSELIAFVRGRRHVSGGAVAKTPRAA